MPAAESTVVEGQLRRARAALENGLRASGEGRVEALLAEYPAVAADAEAALELVYTEFAVREDLGQNPDPADWYARFPQWRADLEQMFEVHRELKKEDERRRSRATTPFLTPPPVGQVPARTIGEFEILGEVGRGGMGVVYKARQPSLGRVVAVKVILSGAHAGSRERERFRREAETAARLDHPNIVRILAVGEHDGRPYCAMEFVDGPPLADLLTAGPWPTRKAAELLAAVAAAADHAHQHGVVHRDLKPANILLTAGPTPAPVPKIVDFGLAKCLLDSDPGPTRTGDILGTPHYMAPEQADATPAQVGPPTDVWAMGVTLYELLVGHPPFQGDSAVETLQQVREVEPVPPRRVRPSIPRDLEVICLKCLRKKPADRYPTAQALADDLNRWLRGEAIRARPVRPTEHAVRWCRRNPVVAGLSVTAVLLAVAAVASWVAHLNTARVNADKLADQQRAAAVEQGELRRAELRRSVKLRVNEGVRLLNDGDCGGAAVLLADALANDPDPENEEVHRVRLGTTLRAMPTLRQSFRVPTRPDPTAPRTDPAALPQENGFLISDDFSTLLTLPGEQSAGVWDLQAGTSRPLTLTDDAGVRLVALSSNGAAVIGLRGRVTLAWATATGRPLALPLPTGYGSLPSPFAPDGSRRLGDGVTTNARQVYVADGTAVGKPLTHDSPVVTAAFGVGGTRVATGSQRSGARVWDAATGEPVSPVLAEGKFVYALALGPDGLSVTTATIGLFQTWEVNTGKLRGSQAQQLTNYVPPQYVPGHPWIATGGWDYGLRVWDSKLLLAASAPMPDTSTLTAFSFRASGDAAAVVDRGLHARVWEPVRGIPLTPKLYAGEGHRAQFSADGTRLVTVTGGGSVRVWDAPPLVPADAVLHPWLAHSAEWLPGGEEVMSVGDGGAVLSRVGDGRAVRKFPHPDCRAMAVRPGTNALVVTLDNRGGMRVWEIATGRELDPAVRSPSAVRAAVFTPDGLLATGGSDGVVRFWDTATGKEAGRELANPEAVFSLSVTPDGGRMLVNYVGQESVLWELPSGRAVRTLRRPPLVSLPAFTPDGGRLAVSTAGGVEVVSAADGVTPVTAFELGRLRRHAFSPDGRYLAHANEELNTVSVAGVADGRPVGRPLPHPPSRRPQSVPLLQFSGDGRFLAMSSESFVVVWEVATGTQVTPPLRVPYVNALRFDESARRLLLVCVDKSVRVIDLSPDTRPVAELAELARLLANRTLDDGGSLVPLDPAAAQGLWEKHRPPADKPVPGR